MTLGCWNYENRGAAQTRVMGPHFHMHSFAGYDLGHFLAPALQNLAHHRMGPM